MNARVIREERPRYGHDRLAPQVGLSAEILAQILERLVGVMEYIDRTARRARTHARDTERELLDEIRSLARQGASVLEAAREDLDTLQS